MGYNKKIDGDLLMACVAAGAGQTVSGEHGVMYMPYHRNVGVRYIGFVRAASKVVIPTKLFYKVEPWQDDYARKLVHLLNYQLHHDGAWSVMWGSPTQDGMPTQINMAYQDVDGDFCFVINSERTLLDMQMTGPESHLENCERAWKQYTGWGEEVEIRPEQKIKAAQGQEQKDPTVQPII